MTKWIRTSILVASSIGLVSAGPGCRAQVGDSLGLIIDPALVRSALSSSTLINQKKNLRQLFLDDESICVEQIDAIDASTKAKNCGWARWSILSGGIIKVESKFNERPSRYYSMATNKSGASVLFGGDSSESINEYLGEIRRGDVFNIEARIQPYELSPLGEAKTKEMLLGNTVLLGVENKGSFLIYLTKDGACRWLQGGAEDLPKCGVRWSINPRGEVSVHDNAGAFHIRIAAHRGKIFHLASTDGVSWHLLDKTGHAKGDRFDMVSRWRAQVADSNKGPPLASGAPQPLGSQNSSQSLNLEGAAKGALVIAGVVGLIWGFQQLLNEREEKAADRSRRSTVWSHSCKQFVPPEELSRTCY